MSARKFLTSREHALLDELRDGARIRGQNGEELTAAQVAIAAQHGWMDETERSWRQGRDFLAKVSR